MTLLAGLLRRYGLIALVLGLLAAAILSGAWRHLNLSELAAHRHALTAFVTAHPVLSVLAYVAIYVLIVVACIPGPGAMTTAGGFLFGTLVGGLAALTACTVGSAIVFLACRTAFGDWATQKAGPIVQRIEAGFTRNAFSYLLTLRLIPMMPFFATNVAAGLARVRLRDLMAATLLGTSPVCFVFAGLGSGLGVVFERGGRIDASLFEEPRIIVPLAGLAALSALPIGWRLWMRRRAA
ncbi:TVP38/TMEM64 family protein [Caulobacter sp. KR2-114]|uniref:TVP38/TMEM64 family protein n=1 Tax=Caulobacter sp. KR2-114 TaxID=3400912 RepID=UPI003C1221F9